MSADPNQSGDFDEFFQSGDRGAYENGPAKVKPEAVAAPKEVEEDWGEPPVTPELLARQARLRRLVIGIVVPLGLASLALIVTRTLRPPESDLTAPPPVAISVAAARPNVVSEHPREELPEAEVPRAPEPLPAPPVAEVPPPPASAGEATASEATFAAAPADSEPPAPKAKPAPAKPSQRAAVAVKRRAPVPARVAPAVRPRPATPGSIATPPASVEPSPVQPAESVRREAPSEALPTATFPLE